MIKIYKTTPNIVEIKLYPTLENIIILLIEFIILLSLLFMPIYQTCDSFKSVTINVEKNKNEVIVTQQNFLFGKKEVKFQLSDIQNAEVVRGHFSPRVPFVDYNLVLNLTSGEKYEIYENSGPSIIQMECAAYDFNKMRENENLTSFKVFLNFNLKYLLKLHNIKNLTEGTKFIFISYLVFINGIIYFLSKIDFCTKLIIDKENKELKIIYNRLIKSKKTVNFSDIKNIEPTTTQILISLKFYTLIFIESYVKKEKLNDLISYLKSHIQTKDTE